LLNAEQKAELTKMADSISTAYNFDLVIVTEKRIGNKEPMDYADDFFDYNGYGLGEDRDGCLFLQVTGDRDYWFSTSGRGIKLLDGNNTAFNKLENDVVKNLREDRYYEAYRSFLLNMEKFLKLEAKGRRYNILHGMWGIILMAAAWLIAFLVGFGKVSFWKKAMNTALLKTQADAYAIPGSINYSNQSDRFITSRVTKTARPKSSSSSGGGGGTHRSSSGRSHGGRGGRY
jgi:uncharacterized protein